MGDPPSGVWDCTAGVEKPMERATAGLALLGCLLGVARRVAAGSGVRAAGLVAWGVACDRPATQCP